MSATAAILDFASAPHRLPSAVRADAERLLADTLAVGAAGAASLEAAKVRAAVSAWGTGEEARAFDGTRLPAPSAAFANGFAIHCLEWDAVHEGAVVHALSTVTAALLASSDRMGGSSVDGFLTALAVGVDVAAGLGLAATGPMRFFRPATAGVIGAALAVARLEMLGRGAMADVLGLAYSAAAGTMQAHVEASIALPLQIASAARAALSAVDLARAGLGGPRDALEGPFGYAALFESLDLPRYTTTLGRRWLISEVSTKPFPSGRASHGVLGLLQRLSYGREIEAHVPPLVHRLVGRPMSTDMQPAHARLCLPFLAALMLRDGRIDPRRFTTATFSNRDLLARAGRVRLTVDENRDPNALSPQRVIVDGIGHDVVHTLGSPDAPLSPEQAAAKHDQCRELAPASDPRLFEHATAYATEPA